MSTIRVAIVEDQAAMRDALKTMIELTPDLGFGGAFDSVEDLRTALEREPERLQQWDVVLMDFGLPGESGLDGTRFLHAQRPELPIVMCTVHDSREEVDAAIRAGASGYLVKSDPLDVLVSRLLELGSGGAPLSPRVARGLLEGLREQSAAERAERAESTGPRVAVDGSSVRLPDGQVVDLRRRQAVRRILARLALAHRERPGTEVSSEQCIQAGWPDERMRWESAQARLWTSIRALRSLGLEEQIETVGQGYRLAADVVIED
ncbi:MAG: response regulator [Myxococcota bacterium]